ncbi:GntR family transcriptional regulator [Sphaerisporangium krabiense]|uniref:GntR family transcriptional regulator n=1 Tax=Sphaerisporangium krabiense TaxID=763782 RepID=A0A7W8Z568_9ACTN|nr:GntR family transcriptional regulator [Sphaerisporangium krabiense]MBB5627611.1 GntR family transcriptional regulator [Sphaerisporangium krabiense]GII66625.1 GntR family transcriptional regulator [Sphaerisporangium krabiense]
MEFHLDRGSGVATYLQLVHQVKHALRLGILVPGDRLPTAKEVVEKLAINPNTALKAYRELEREGLVIARPGQGTFVERALGGASLAEHARLRRDLLRWVRAAREAGLDQEDVQALIASAVGEAFRDDEQAPATRKDEIA